MNSGDERYFERIENELETARDLAEEARRRGGDPQPTVEIPTARDMADRVENILGIEGVAERVRELEGKMSREEAALALVEDFVEGAVGSYETPDGKIEGAVRTAVALLTEGVVAAPIEGIDRVEVAENDDGSEYVTVAYAGPIRSAGGTAQALSVLVADYARSLLGIDEFKPRDDEIERYVEEVDLYDSETGLQYSPKDEETRYITKHCPIMLDGEATGDEEVSGFRDLERIDTNSSRGGMCLVLAEGIALKAPKIRRYTDDLDEVEWPWLTDLIEGTIAGDKSGEEATDQEEDEGADETGEEASGPPRIPSNKKYLQDLIAGRPVFGHPSAPGGFRLRYGRSRNLGHATAGVHPATMHVVDDFLAPGTQIKTELPGKAAGIVPVDTIEGPTVRLANGEVTRIDDAERALELRNGVEAIIDLGEYLVNYGEFVENNHDLAPAGYTVEWWRQDMAAAGADVQALADDPAIDLHAPAPEQALAWAAEYDAPLHPTYTHCWHDLEWEDVVALAEAVEAGSIDDGDLVVEGGREIQKTLEVLLVEHTQDGDRARIPTWRPLVRTLGITENLERGWSATELSEDARSWDTAMVAVAEIAPFSVQERAPTRIGNRMGRPEKSEERELQPAVHSLFPIGEAGGNQRDVAAAAKHSDSMRDQPGVIDLEIGVRRCEPCDEETYKSRCPSCGDHLEPYYTCPECNQELEPDEAGRVYCDRCEVTGDATETRPIDVHEAYRAALEGVGEREGSFDILKGVKGLSSTTKTPEPLEKGVLRAKHGVSSFKDGTVRYDMTDLPVTAIKPAEVGVSPEQLRELGYEMDIDGEPLRHDDQVVELKVQDVILSKGGADHLLRTADFVDDLLESYYGMNSYYELEERADLVGELVFGMAPHTSAAVVGRVIGYTSVAGGYAHPYFHAAKRRNCFHPDTKIWIENENGEMAYRRIEDVVEPKLEDPNLDDFGTKFSEVGDLSVPSLSEGGTECLQPVTTVSKHPAPDHMVAIRTRSGRELTVTPDHEMIVHDGDQHRVEAAAVEAGMHLPAPKSIEYEGRNNRIDLVKAFLEQSNLPLDRLVIGNIGPDRIRELFEIGTDEPGFCKPVAEAFDISTSTVYNWINRGAVPASILVELLGRDAVVTELGSQVTLSVKRDHVELQRYLTIDEDVATVLGYYTAEGFVRKEGTCYQTTICTPDDPVREFCLETIKEALGVEAYEENEYKITVSSHLVARLFSDLLELGSDAKSKRIPREIFSSSDAVVSRYLAAYFSGDGSTSSTRLDVRAHTVSEELARDLVAILKRFGISAKRYQEARRVAGGVVGDFYEDDVEFDSWVIKITSENARKYARTVGFDLDRKQDTLENTISEIPCRSQRRLVDGGDTWLDEVIDVTIIESDISHTYCLTVEETHSLVANNLYTGQCDGDEDCVMLLLDGLLNFSKQYLPDKRGGRMDAPLVMSSRIDPAEIDDEAHNVDTMNEYPRGFYEATRELADPGEVEDLMTLAESSVGTESQYEGFVHSQPTTDIAAGPDLSAYKTLESMEHKMDAQLELARKLRAVDETDVAERVIEYHFLPDLIGNLRAFSRQEFLCKGCGEKFRRAPLSGTCRECGDDVNLTVHEGSVNKYLETASEVAEEYGCRGYTKQRLEVLGRSIDRIFENDKNKQSGIADFM